MGCRCEQSGMSGCCGSGLSGLYGLDNLMGGLMGELLAAGSQVRVGFEFEMANTDYGLNAEAQGFQNVATALRQHLLELGTFSAVNVAIKPPQYAGLQNGYITVQVTAADGQSNPSNIGDMAQYKLSDYQLGIVVTRRDREVIDYIPPDAVGKAGVAQTTQSQQQALPQALGQPSQCNWNAMSFGDFVACQLGISSPLGGVGVGAIGALTGVAVITLLAVVLLKR